MVHQFLSRSSRQNKSLKNFLMDSLVQRTGINMIDAFEKIPCTIFKDLQEGSVYAANMIAEAIREANGKGKKLVLGLAIGSTPKTLYKELVRMHCEEGLSFKNVITFNLDEYYPIEKNAFQSYHSFMHRHLFDHIDIDPANIYIPDGTGPREELKKCCAVYEETIEFYGGIDLQVLGIGNNGHIGFNEPGSSIYSRTRLINLDYSTRVANSHEF